MLILGGVAFGILGALVAFTGLQRLRRPLSYMPYLCVAVVYFALSISLDDDRPFTTGAILGLGVFFAIHSLRNGRAKRRRPRLRRPA